MSSNATTVNAIITNLKTILGTTLSYKLDYDIADDPDVDTNKAATLLYAGEEFDDVYGERPAYNVASFVVEIKFRASDPDTRRQTAVNLTHGTRDAITEATLNIGDLSASKLVVWAICRRSENDNQTPVQTITQEYAIQYRES